jgi:hypothetical protein
VCHTKKQPFRPNRHRSVNIANRRDTACRVQPNRHRSVNIAIVRSTSPSFGQNRRRWFGQTQRGYGQNNGCTDTASRVPLLSFGFFLNFAVLPILENTLKEKKKLREE